MVNLRSTLLTTAVLAGAVLAPAAASAQAETVLATEQAATTVAAYHGTVMWSSLNPATRRYRLVKSVDGGAPVAVGVGERSGGPFDVDLGTNRSGEIFAVYSRCADGDSGCDLYRLRVSTGAEEKLSTLSAPGSDERAPSIQRGKIAFIRHERGYDYLRTGDTTSGSKGTTSVLRRSRLLSVELGIRHIAFVQGDPKAEFGRQGVYVHGIRSGRNELVYRATSGGANAARVTKPSFMDDLSGFVWARTNNGSGTGNRLIRYTLSTGKLSYASGSPRWSSTAWAGDELGAVASSSLTGDTEGDVCTGNVNDPPEASLCTVALTGPVTFDRRP